MNAQRPAQVTLAMVLIVGGAVLVIVTAWERIGGLHTIEGQQQLAKLVEQGQLGGLGVGSLATILRVLCLIGGGAAAAAAVLAGQVPKRSRSARIALSVLAPLVLLGWFGTAGFYEPFLLTGIVLLWLPPTADWYAGRDPGAKAVPAPPAPPAPSAPPVLHHPLPPAPPAWAPSAYPPLARRRPAPLVRACITTWVCASLTAVAVVGAIVWLTTSGDAFVADVIDRSHATWGSMADSLTTTQVRVELYVILAGFLLWCLAAMVLAVLTWFGHGWARILLAISAIGAGVCALIGALAFLPLLLVAAGCGMSAFQLLRGEAAGWGR
ncbi:MAG TPA: hypothetical protein VJ872_19450 [Nocardioides sp.]|nr:hypothetical protein [Nocardioides sp.]